MVMAMYSREEKKQTRHTKPIWLNHQKHNLRGKAINEIRNLEYNPSTINTHYIDKNNNMYL
jgi:hypothetical protein